MSGGRIKNNYGEADGLSGEAAAQIIQLRDEIIPRVKREWDETMAGFSGDGANAFSDITANYHARLEGLDAAADQLIKTIMRITGTGGDVQSLDKRLSTLFTQ